MTKDKDSGSKDSASTEIANTTTSNDLQNKHPNPALIEKFITLQEKELVMRGQELELRKQNDSNSHEYAKAALDANLVDRNSERKHVSDQAIYRYIFAGVAILLLVVLIVFALFLDKDQIVMEIIKAIMFFGSGGIGGYALGKSNSKDSKNN